MLHQSFYDMKNVMTVIELFTEDAEIELRESICIISVLRVSNVSPIGRVRLLKSFFFTMTLAPFHFNVLKHKKVLFW